MFLLLALTAVGAAMLAWRRGAARWAALWGLAAGGIAVALFVAVALALLAIPSGESRTDCFDSRSIPDSGAIA
jgi:hypothetical protein